MMRGFFASAMAFALTLAGCVLSPIRAMADPVSVDQVLLLVDLSTSMKDRDSNREIKIEGAKSGITSLLDALPGSARVGLMTYPGDADCGDPTLVRDIQPLSQGNLGATVAALPEPNGNTPTALALRKAAEVLQRQSGAATIVLVSDGLANCNVDPCPVAAEIAASGIGVTVNTVGFAIDEAGRKQLQCIADATGGRYVDVQNGDDLGGELAKQMTPKLEIWAQYPSGVTPVTSVGATVSARIVNTSSVTATNVRVALSPTGEGVLLGVLRPVFNLGNLATGESRQLDWTIPVAMQLAGRTVELKVSASGANAPIVTSIGAVRFGNGNVSVIGDASKFRDVDKVAVLGDSFSAGDGTQSKLEAYAKNDTWDYACRVSDKAYSEVLFPGRVTNFACTGAKTGDVVRDHQYGRVVPQVLQLKASLRRGARFDLVFLTIGGNDVGFNEIATICAARTIANRARPGSVPNVCPVEPGSAYYDAEQDLLNSMGPRLQETYRQVAMAFADLHLKVPPIVVSPYPLMFPNDPSLRRSCGAINLGISMKQVGYFLDFQRQLNRLIEEAVNRSRSDDGVPVYFASGTEYAMQPGHTVCGSSPWIVRPSVDNLALPWLKPIHWDTPFHPNASGQASWALTLARWGETPELTLSGADNFPASPDTLPAMTAAPQQTIDGDQLQGAAGLGSGIFTVSGLAPASPVIAMVHSNPYALGYGTADASGQARFPIWLDAASLSPGLHELRVTVTESDGTTRTRISRLYIMRAVPYFYWALLALGFGLLACGVLWRRTSSGMNTPDRLLTQRS